jgi:hypothetical protein
MNNDRFLSVHVGIMFCSILVLINHNVVQRRPLVASVVGW